MEKHFLPIPYPVAGIKWLTEKTTGLEVLNRFLDSILVWSMYVPLLSMTSCLHSASLGNSKSK